MPTNMDGSRHDSIRSLLANEREIDQMRAVLKLALVRWRLRSQNKDSWPPPNLHAIRAGHGRGAAGR